MTESSAKQLRRHEVGPGLLKVEEARRLLAECTRVDEAKDIRDKAAAIRVYLRQQGASREAQNDAAEIKLRAERCLGELLAEHKDGGERANQGTHRKKLQPATSCAPPPPTLRDLGIERYSAKRWQDVARVPEAKFEAFIQGQRDRPDGEITTAGLRREHVGEVRRQERIGTLAEIAKGARALGGIGRFPILYADPPWRYEHAETESRAVENQYPTMALDDICALDVTGICTPDAVLFIWSTSPKLAEAMRVLSAWAFEYRTCLVWVKDKIGMGYYARQQHELLLVATRGAPPTPPPASRPSSVVEAPRGQHSAKPQEFYELIERMYPDLPRVELFARAGRDGWAAWGNQHDA